MTQYVGTEEKPEKWKGNKIQATEWTDKTTVSFPHKKSNKFHEVQM